MTPNTDVENREISIGSGRERIAGTLAVPARPRGSVIFAHGSGSSRFSVRNRFVARVLQQSQMSTLLLDLLTPEEEAIDTHTAAFRFDIRLLARRLAIATDWCHDNFPALPIGYFGPSTGAAAALVAAAERPENVRAIVSRGGRPDLAGNALTRVKAPTLLIVGSRDRDVLALNQSATRLLRCEHELRIVPNATHLFEEPGALEEVARLAVGWFVRHFDAG